MPLLSQRFRVVIHDHLGFGLSDKPLDYSYSLLEQAQIAVGVWRALGIESAHLLGHDYGTSVAAEVIALRERGLLPLEISSLTLTNGSVHLELAKRRLIQHLLASETFGPLVARFAGRNTFKKNLRAVLADPFRLVDRELDLHWDALAENGGRAVLPKLARYNHERVRFAARWIPALLRFDRRSLILWGREDPVAVPDIAEKLAEEMKQTTLVWLDGLGHYPMIEDPKRFAGALLDWL